MSKAKAIQMVQDFPAPAFVKIIALLMICRILGIEVGK